MPTSHGYGTLNDVTSLESYEQGLRRFYFSHRPGTMVMLYNDILAGNDRIHKQVCTSYTCLSFLDMGVDVPEKWCAEVDEIAVTQSRLARFQGRLGPVSLKQDLSFESLTDSSAWTRYTNVYIYNTCARELGPCGDSD